MLFHPRYLAAAVLLAGSAALVARAEPVGTAFTFQSVITDSGAPVDGPIDLRLSLWSDAAAGAQVGPTLTEPVTASEGKVTATLDFGTAPFDQPEAMWLQIEISLDGGGSWSMVGRQRLTPTPYAVNAQNAVQAQTADLANFALTADFATLAEDSNNTRGITVLSDGKVGIGTATPGFRLTLEQPGHGFSHTWDSDGNGSADVDVTTFVNGSGGWIGTRTNKPMYLYTNDSAPRVTLDTLGNLGVGTQSPQSRLDVRDLTAGGTAVRVNQNGSGDTVGVDSVVITGVGVRGEAQDPDGTSYGVLGVVDPGSTGWGVFSQGRIGASGTKSFVIDHPLNPADKLLLHYSSEAPEPLNTYSGTVVLDSAGRAIVRLPDYFESINTDYRYQLTAIGGAAPSLHVASEVLGNAFAIAGGAAGLKVSWEVTARRNDAFVRLKGSPRELLKAPGDRGKYLLPEAYGGGNAQRMNTIERIEEN